MSFTQAIEAGFKNYVNFNGRALRSEYWFWFLFVVLAQVVLAIVDSVMGLNVLTIVFGLAALLPGIAVSIRRLHDIDKSGWFLLLSLIPIVGAIIVLVWMCQAGTPGPNRFGPARVVTA
jgi:uncharacterized membrane protein YhaH (DUF805 family)